MNQIATSHHNFDLNLRDIRSRFGPTAVIRLSSSAVSPVAVIPTGIPALDHALGVGGIPRGRVTEIYGPEMAGKTTLCQLLIASEQALGGLTAFIDMEHALDLAYAARCGVVINDLYISQPDSGEQALEIAEAIIRAGATLVVVDSVSALVPRAEIEGEMGDNFGSLQARLMSQALRKLVGSGLLGKSTLVFTNQLRQKTGVMFGNPETTTGGMALRFYASVRLDLRRVETIKRGDEVTGSRVKAVVKKNKVAAPFRVAEFDLLFSTPAPAINLQSPISSRNGREK